jgi:hypothetical protein
MRPVPLGDRLRKRVVIMSLKKGFLQSTFFIKFPQSKTGLLTCLKIN